MREKEKETTIHFSDYDAQKEPHSTVNSNHVHFPISHSIPFSEHARQRKIQSTDHTILNVNTTFTCWWLLVPASRILQYLRERLPSGGRCVKVGGAYDEEYVSKQNEQIEILQNKNK